MAMPSSLARACNSRFQRRTRTPLLPPQSAVIRSFVACGYRAPHRLPPAPNRVDCEARSVLVDANTHPPGIVGDVVDAVGCRPTKFRDDEVVHPHWLGLPLRTVLTAAIL